jgi:hypothetical protein
VVSIKTCWDRLRWTCVFASGVMCRSRSAFWCIRGAKHASEGNPESGWGWVRRLTRCYRVTRVMSGEMGNLVVKVDVMENVEEGLMMANTELLEAWVSSVIVG